MMKTFQKFIQELNTTANIDLPDSKLGDVKKRKRDNDDDDNDEEYQEYSD